MLVTATLVTVPATDLVKDLREKLAATRVDTEALRAASTDNKWVWFSSQDSSPTQSVADPTSWAANTYKQYLLPDYRAVKSARFGRELVFSTWYGRRHLGMAVDNLVWP
jgi:hypothetical protein